MTKSQRGRVLVTLLSWPEIAYSGGTMTSRKLLLLSVLAIALGAARDAQAQVETIVVTAESRHEASDAPHLSMIKRADHVITRVSVSCDTRDLSQRRAELKATLRDLIRTAASTPTISLGIGDTVLLDLSESNFDQIIAPDSRVDTSKAEVIIKSAVSKDDSFNAATARIASFIAKTPKAGRTEILREGPWNLTIVGPEQYRDPIMAMIVADAKHTADAFGPGYGVSIEGLEHQVSWYQKGPLDLGLYIPYALKIAPVTH